MQGQVFDVIIVGAGAAGLMAALELALVDKKIAVVEARDRVGGRIHTLEGQGFDIPVEIGAEFVHGRLTLTKWLFEKGGIPSYEVSGDIWRKKEKGLEKEGDFIDDYSMLRKKLKSLETDLPVAAFMNTYLNEREHEALRTSLKTYVEGYYAADTTKASTLALREELEKADEEQYRVEGGYKKLIGYLVQELEKKNCSLIRSAPVQDITWEKEKVAVKTGKGTLHGRKAIISVPLGVLQSGALRITPPLPHMEEAARKLGFGPVIKIILQFSKAFWKQKEYTGQKDLGKAGFIFSQEEVPTWWTAYPKEASILTGWLGGPNAEKFKDLSEEEILQKALHSLSKLFTMEAEALKGMLNNYAIHNWSMDPYCCGGYSYDVVEGSRQKQILKQPVENTLFFTGEALFEGIEVGTVEAALVSGRETARLLIASL